MKASHPARFCQNQDFQDYWIFRIRPARVSDSQALVDIRIGGVSSRGEKRNPCETKS